MCVQMLTCVYIKLQELILPYVIPKCGILNDCGGRNERWEEKKRKKKRFEFISVTLIKCLKLSLGFKETGEVNQ